jgi:outer membrane protein OmpA-like peptidoglycan-associated protein
MLPALGQAEGPPDGEAEAEPDDGTGAGAEASGGFELSASPEAGVDADADADADASGDAKAKKTKQPSKWDARKDQRWIVRWAPEPHMIELGIYGGLFKLAETHELFDPDVSLPDQGYLPLRKLNPDLGARIGYYPIRFFGIEAEGGAMPSKIIDGDGVTPFTVRGHAVAQLGLWSVTPFVLVGAGMLGIGGGSPLGSDIDPALHFGGGVKVYLNRWVMLRLDARDVVTHQLGVDNTFKSHNLELLLGLSVTLNRKNKKPEPGPEPEPLPDALPGDRDGDGFLDNEDTCPDEAETVNGYQDEDGCPELDSDGDSFFDDQDACPEEAGVAPDGCPIRDKDGDGILDDVDACIDEPETVNGFEDTDGCPDTLPDAVARFNGNIKGITFDTGKATIKRTSIPVLDEAVRVLQEHPSLRIEIAGHTDNAGKHDSNMTLSADRAESVKSYLVGMGVSEDRIVTKGYGPDVPIDTNDTKTGRSNNRRIEFKIQTGNQ